MAKLTIPAPKLPTVANITPQQAAMIKAKAVRVLGK